MSRHNALPYHFYVNIKNEFLGPTVAKGVTPALWHAVYSREDQIIMSHVLLETGAHWTGLPLHAISSTKDFSYTEHDLMPWSCMGTHIDVTHLQYLEGLPVTTRLPIKTTGRHTGIMIDWLDGYSRYAQEHKPLNMIHLTNGQFALLPNNFITCTDKHFTTDKNKDNLKHYLRGEKIYWGE